MIISMTCIIHVIALQQSIYSLSYKLKYSLNKHQNDIKWFSQQSRDCLKLYNDVKSENSSKPLESVSKLGQSSLLSYGMLNFLYYGNLMYSI